MIQQPKARNPGIWPLVLILLSASLAVVALDPQTNAGRDSGAVRKANNGGDFLDASAVRVNLDVPSNASSVASLSAHNALMQAHGCTSVASAASLPNNASFTYDGLGGFATAGTNGIPANASFTLAGLSAKAFSDLTSIPTTIFGYGLTDAASTALVTDHTGDSSDPHGANLAQTNASMTRLDVSGKACISYQGVAQQYIASETRLLVDAEYNGVVAQFNSASGAAGETMLGLSCRSAGATPPAQLGYIVDSDGWDNGTKGSLVFRTRAVTNVNTPPTERMRIDAAGNVGIGTSPAYLLHINAAEPRIIITDSDSGTLGTDGTYWRQDNANSYIVNQESGELKFGTNNTYQMTILATGPASLNTVPDYADNAAAIAGGLGVGNIYRNGDVLMIVH